VSDRTRLFYWTSEDGRTWTGSRRRAVARSGTQHDARGHYRSTLVATEATPPRWDVWVTGEDGSGRNVFGDVWRIGLLRDIDLVHARSDQGHREPRVEWRWQFQAFRGRWLEQVLIGTARLRGAARWVLSGSRQVGPTRP
jgi:hypothetical protein